MKNYTAQNADETRRAVAAGKRVWFYRRCEKSGADRSFYPVTNETYDDFEAACEAADAWVARGIIMAGRRKRIRNRMRALSAAASRAQRNAR